uniref:Uncharacterized protein n=1 Tax=viral metagenome TaxID=1070528 RepID=A0A6C0ECC1_9ZZZZ
MFVYYIVMMLKEIVNLCSDFIKDKTYVYKPIRDSIVILKKIDKTKEELNENIVDIDYALIKGNTFVVSKIINKYDPKQEIEQLTNPADGTIYIVDNEVMNVTGLYYFHSIERAYYYHTKQRDIDTGTYIEWYENGAKKKQCYHLCGKLEGLYMEWYENQNIKNQTTYTNGNIYSATGYYKNGSIRYEYTNMLDKNEICMQPAQFKLYYENGDIANEYNKNDKIVISYFKKEIEQKAEVIEFDEYKTFSYNIDVNDINLPYPRICNVTRYMYPNEIYCYKLVNGAKNGEYKFLIDNHLIEAGVYSNDKKSGKWVCFNKTNNRKEYEGNYYEGEKSGLWKYWDDNGNCKTEYYFLNELREIFGL